MYLKALEIQGFKSFPDKTVLPFNEQITAVVGPNGSGKSNISDAIRWVVGEQSVRTLRGGKMEDVIFGGTEKRKQTGYAEVSLIMDNSQNIFPMEETEVMVTRRYYRSGESKYYINRHSRRLRDVQELFMGTGLGKEGYALIGQGRIDEILSVKSSQRREIFEEAAGIAKYRHQKEESQRKLEKVEENMLRIADIIAELERQVVPLKEKSEKAQKFFLLRDELRVLQISVWLEQLVLSEERRTKLEEDYTHAFQEREGVSKELEEIFNQTERLSYQMAAKGQEETKLREELEESQGDVLDKETQISLLKNDIANNETNAKRATENVLQRTQRQKELREQLEQKESISEEMEQRQQKLQEDSQAKTKEAHDYAQQSQVMSGRLNEIRVDIENQQRNLGVQRETLSGLSSSSQGILDQETSFQKELAQLQEGLTKEEQRVKDFVQKLQESEEGRQEAVNSEEGYRLLLEGLERRFQALKDQEEDLARQNHRLSTEAKMLKNREEMYSDFYGSVKKIMQEAKAGGLHHVHGPVAELITVGQDHTLAIETALGNAMQNIVVDHSADAKAIVDFLKRLDKGDRATILPLSSIQEGYLSQKEALSKEEGFVGIGDELVQFHPDYAKVMSNLLGRTVIMTDFRCADATAKRFQHKVRIVTLDGQVFNTGGSITGGAKKRSSGILNQKVKLDQLTQEVQGLEKQQQELFPQREALEREISAAKYQQGIAQSELRQWEDLLLQSESDKNSAVRGMESLQQQYNQRKARHQELLQRGSAVDIATNEAKTQVEQIQNLIQGNQEQWDILNAEYRTLQRIWQETEDLAKEQSNELALLVERTSLVREGREALQTLLDEVTQELESDTNLIADFGSANEECNQKIVEMEKGKIQSKEQCENLRLAISTCQMERQGLEKERNEKNNLSRNKNVHLNNLEREVTRLEENKNQAEREKSEIVDKMWDEYNITHRDALALQIPIESLGKAIQQIDQLKQGISRLGAVDVTAVEEYHKINERYTYYIQQRDDVLEAKSELENIIGDIVRRMEEIFSTEFARINEAFGKTFVQLFGGGRGEVVLEDEKDVLGTGIEIRVQPPGKALKVLSLLSGGEKAFVAIALYFAILQIRPTPFVVMDEIEAALDDGNIERFVHYLREICDRTQFIIITHRRGTMEAADVLYGITMQEKGVSCMLRLSLSEVEEKLGDLG